MGVMSCYRNGCENIMCDTYVDSIGYICWECQKEFKEYLEHNNKDNLTVGKIENELEIFMASRKDTCITKNNKMSINEFFEKHTR